MWNIHLLQRDHARGRREHITMEEDAMRRGGVAADVNVRTKSMFKRRSPAGQSLKDNTTPRVLRIGKKGTLRILWPKHTASYLEHGTVPHEIRPRRKRFLRFVSRDGNVVFARKVQHPGTRPYHFGFHAQKAAYHEMGQRLRFGMNRVSRIF